MFGNLPAFDGGGTNIDELASTMMVPPDANDLQTVPANEPPTKRENTLIPAGYKYLRDFIGHDISDPGSDDDLRTCRSPRLELDSLYGQGPSRQLYLYRDGSRPDPHPQLGFEQRGVILLEGESRDNAGDNPNAPQVGPDLPRNSEGRAIIADPRNDENLIISQLHGLFIRFHNRVVERVFEDTGYTGQLLLQTAQRIVRWHYQWMVVDDFLRRIVDGDPGDGSTNHRSVISDLLRVEEYPTSAGGNGRLLRTNLRFYRQNDRPYVPVEFSCAAFQFGCAMERPSYFVND